METENINERYSKIVNELYENNKSSFAKAVGVSPTVIENILGTRKGNPGFDVLQKTIYANANISPEWLLIGEGEMLKSEMSTKQSEVVAECLLCQSKDKLIVSQEKTISAQEKAIAALESENNILKKGGVYRRVGEGRSAAM